MQLLGPSISVRSSKCTTQMGDPIGKPTEVIGGLPFDGDQWNNFALLTKDAGNIWDLPVDVYQWEADKNWNDQ